MKGNPSRFLAGLLGNKGVKIVALFLALITWYAIREEISFEKSVTDIPIDILVDEGWAVLDRSEHVATVLLQGPEDVVWELNQDNIRIEVDIRGSTAKGTLPIQLDPRHVHTPRGVRTMEILPSRILLSLDQEGEARVPVHADIQGKLPEGFEVESVICRPATARLLGPLQRLASIEAISTAPIDLEGRLRSFQLRVALEAPNEAWAARIDPAYVTVDVKIVERSATRKLADIPVRAMVGSGQQVSVTPWPAEVSVVFSGHAEKLEALDPNVVFAYVDCDGLVAGGSYELPVQVHVPGGLTVQEVEPASVTAGVEGL